MAISLLYNPYSTRILSKKDQKRKEKTARKKKSWAGSSHGSCGRIEKLIQHRSGFDDDFAGLALARTLGGDAGEIRERIVNDLAFEGGHWAEDLRAPVAGGQLGRFVGFAYDGDALLLPVVVDIEREGGQVVVEFLASDRAEGVLERLKIDSVLADEEVGVLGCVYLKHDTLISNN